MDSLGRKPGETDWRKDFGFLNGKSTAFTDLQQDRLLQIEEGSWWFQYRAEIITKMMGRFFHAGTVTADVGGGNGYTSWAAQKKGFKMLLVEPSEQACRNAMGRGLKTYCGTVLESYPDEGAWSQVTLLDVLEHIEDDRGFLCLLHKKLAMGGYLLITVPAFRCLWSSEDDEAGHFRRYRKKQLARLLKECGYNVLYKNYFMQFLFLPILTVRAGLERIGLLKPACKRDDSESLKIAEKQFKTTSPVIKAGLAVFEGIEERLMAKSDTVLFGSSILVVAQKK